MIKLTWEDLSTIRFLIDDTKDITDFEYYLVENFYVRFKSCLDPGCEDYHCLWCTTDKNINLEIDGFNNDYPENYCLKIYLPSLDEPYDVRLEEVYFVPKAQTFD